MRTRLEQPPPRWTPEYQRRINDQIERALERINESALPPAGGTTGQSLKKKTGKDFDLEWA